MRLFKSSVSIKQFFVLTVAFALLVLSTNTLSYGSKSTKPEQTVYFIEPQDNATVGREFSVVMGVSGMTVKPAGEIIKNTGHHHLLLNEESIVKGEVVPAGSPTHLHFGKGQVETTVTLAPGKHVLSLQFANGAHQSYGEQLRASVTVNVE